MKKISKADILGLNHWAHVRAVLRPVFIHEKERRRLAVGSHLTFLFENTATVWYQIEEMIRSEGMTDDGAIQRRERGPRPQPAKRNKQRNESGLNSGLHGIS